jgi:hypothetical protein
MRGRLKPAPQIAPLMSDGSVLKQMPARPDGARRASSKIGLALFFGCLTS